MWRSSHKFCLLFARTLSTRRFQLRYYTMLQNSSEDATEKKKILVTGGTGLVGRAISKIVESDPLVKQLRESWVFISHKECDLRNEKLVFALFETHRPTHVIHLAALVGGLFKNMRQQADFFNDNLAINNNVLKAANAFNVEKVVSCLSTCIFPDKTVYPITEDMIHLGPPHNSNFGYAYAKRMLDVANHAYFEQHGRIYTSVVPTNVFGPFDNFHLQDSHVIPGLIHKCYIAKQSNQPFIVYGSGKPLRQFIYSLDLAKLFIWVLRSYNSVEPLILSVSEQEEVTIKQVADTIVDLLEFKGDYRFDTSKADGQLKKTASNDKLMKLLKQDQYEFCFTPFRQALEETIQWFEEMYPNIRM